MGHIFGKTRSKTLFFSIFRGKIEVFKRKFWCNTLFFRVFTDLNVDFYPIFYKICKILVVTPGVDDHFLTKNAGADHEKQRFTEQNLILHLFLVTFRSNIDVIFIKMPLFTIFQK